MAGSVSSTAYCPMYRQIAEISLVAATCIGTNVCSRMHARIGQLPRHWWVIFRMMVVCWARCGGSSVQFAPVNPYSSAKRVMKTYSPKPREITQEWYVVDATDQTLGRLATRIADTLRGKNKPQWAPHIDTGDYVVVLNAEKIAVTGNKLQKKIYYRHSGYPGGLRQRTLAEMLDRRPEEVMRKAVRGMLPRNRMGRAQLLKLKVYAGGDHPHEAQSPKPLSLEGVK